MDVSLEPAKKTGRGCLVLFGLVFFIFGLGAGYANIRGVVKSLNAKHWTPTEAIILDSSLKVSHGDESDTYRAVGRFKYQWNGDTYTSDQILFSKTSDSDRKFHNRLVREMRSSKSSRKPMTAYVNPKQPGQAVLYPAIRWNMVGFMGLFSLIFGGVGGAIIFAGYYVGRLIDRENKRKLLHPERPWLWKDEWQTAEIKNSSKASFYAVLGFGVLWNLISLPILFIVPVEILEKKNYIASIGLIFPIVGIGFLIGAFITYRKWKRFGDSRFVMNTFPAAIGNALQGTLNFKEPLPLDTVFNVKLSNIFKYSTGSGDDRRTVEDIKWQDEQQIPLSAGNLGPLNSLPVRFRLPGDQNPSAWDESDREYIWRLNIQSKQDGVDFDQQFDVPVFDPKTYNIRIPASARVNTNTRPADRFTDQGDWQRTGVQAFELNGGHAYYFKAARHKVMGFGLIFMFLVFGGVGIAPAFSDMPLFFGIVFGGFALLLGWLATVIWLYKTQIETQPGKLTVRAGLFGGSYRTIEAANIKSIDINSTMSSGTTKYYDIFATSKDGQKIKLAIHLLGKRDVKALVKRIKKDLGLSMD